MVRHTFRAGLALMALGATALGVGLVRRAYRRLGDWESLTCQDAPEGSFVTLSDRAQLHYVARGETGEPVILIHGLMSTASEWNKNIDALSRNHRAFAIDLLGFGFSSRVTEPCYSLKYHARSVCEFLDAQGLERTSFVAHSLGGAVALQFAHDYPERTDRLVLLAPAIYLLKYLRHVQYVARVPYLPRTVMSLVLCNPDVHRVALRNALGDPGRLDEETLAARVRATQVQGSLNALLAMAASPQVSDVPERLESIQAPSLLVWGDRDLAVPLRHVNRLKRALPKAELVILRGAGHIPNEEVPETVNKLILDFLT